jgi:hypothetical protein
MKYIVRLVPAVVGELCILLSVVTLPLLNLLLQLCQYSWLFWVLGFGFWVVLRAARTGILSAGPRRIMHT